MTVEIAPDLVTRVQTTFAALAPGTFPPPFSLTTCLTTRMPAQDPPADLEVTPEIAGMFMTASVEMWHRAVHSFLYSAALTERSSVWSAVIGYYASHYSVRAIAHLLGHFQLFSIKRNVEISLQNGRHVCKYTKKGGGHGDHRFFWKKVKQDPYFAPNALFTMNVESERVSDSAHRGRANYGDHLNQFRPFGIPTLEELVRRVEYISNIVFTAPPIPDRDRYPDAESVQVVAYHRIVCYRRFLDEILGGGNNFWARHRTPQWCDGVIDFQLVEQDGIMSM